MKIAVYRLAQSTLANISRLKREIQLFPQDQTRRDNARNFGYYLRNAGIVEIIHREAEFCGPLAVNKYHLEREIQELLDFAHPLAHVPFDHSAFAEIITRLDSLAWMLAELRGKIHELRAPRLLRRLWPSHKARAA